MEGGCQLSVNWSRLSNIYPKPSIFMTKIIFRPKNFLVKIILGERKLLDGQMSSGQMLPGQMSLTFVKNGPRNLPLKFGQNWVSNS